MQVKLFVGNLPYSVNSEELKELFTPFGGVVSAKVVSDRETGRSRGFGFVSKL
jgi:RNA recognition motif-containing protein